jgi:hypothetical protein
MVDECYKHNSTNQFRGLIFDRKSPKNDAIYDCDLWPLALINILTNLQYQAEDMRANPVLDMHELVI